MGKAHLRALHAHRPPVPDLRPDLMSKHLRVRPSTVRQPLDLPRRPSRQVVLPPLGRRRRGVIRAPAGLGSRPLARGFLDLLFFCGFVGRHGVFRVFGLVSCVRIGFLQAGAPATVAVVVAAVECGDALFARGDGSSEARTGFDGSGGFGLGSRRGEHGCVELEGEKEGSVCGGEGSQNQPWENGEREAADLKRCSLRGCGRIRSP